MPRRSILVVIFSLLMGFLSVPAYAGAQSMSPEDQVAIAAVWQGTWTADNFIYEAQLHLIPGAMNTVDGYIRWTLRRSPRANEQSRLGLKGIEYVRGTYLPRGRVLSNRC